MKTRKYEYIWARSCLVLTGSGLLTNLVLKADGANSPGWVTVVWVAACLASVIWVLALLFLNARHMRRHDG
jgi:hypothetical protein